MQGLRNRDSRLIVGTIESISLVGLTLFAVGGCVAGGSFGLTESPRQQASGVSVAPGDLAGVQARLRQIVPGGVIDDLYFPMQDRPYDRATIAVALKACQTLANDLKLRQHDAGRTTEKQRRRALAWFQRAFDRLGEGGTASAQPEVVEWDRWLNDSQEAKGHPASVFAFVDRDSIERNGPKFGGFDLVVSTGQPIYPLVAKPAADIPSLEKYASALEIGLISLGSIRAVTLRDMITRPGGSSGNKAIVDAPEGETWGAMIARRALCRGATGSLTYNAIGISTPKGDRSDLAARARAAMWVQAIDGQRLGLVEGWRGARDDGAPSFPSRLADPDWLEAVAHASLEIRQHSALIEPFRNPRSLSVVVDVSAIDPQRPNAWTAEFTTLADALVDWQIRFDVVTASTTGTRSPHPYKMHFKPGPDFCAEGAAEEASRLLSKRAPELRAIILTETNGDMAKRLYVRQSADGQGLAIVNLSGETRRLKLRKASGKGTPSSFVDQLTGQSVRRSIVMAPYAVHILMFRQP